MSEKFPLQAISEIAEHDKIRVVLFINGELIHAPLHSLFGVTGSAVYDPGSLLDGQGVTTTVTVNGAELGNFVEVSFSLDLQGITVTGWVSAANTVSVRFQNETGGTIDLASGTIKARARI